MKKVLFVINTMGYGGAEKALIELLKKLDPDQYEISLYVLLSQGELLSQIPSYVKLMNTNYSDASVLSDAGKQILKKNVIRQLFSNGAVFKNIPYLIRNLCSMAGRKKIQLDKLLWKVMADGAERFEETYDVAVAYLEGGSTYYVKKYVKAKQKAAFLHVDYAQAGYNRKLDEDCYLAFDRIFTVSEEVQKSFLCQYPECRNHTFIFHNIIDPDEIRRKAELDGGFEDSFDGYRILTVGRLTMQKAYEVAISAMEQIKKSGIPVRWYVLGEGELRKKLQAQIDAAGLTDDFRLLGVTENPYPFYRQCDLYVHATRFEGKSIAVQEAQILGCAILVSDTSGNREQLKNGVDGEMCSLDAGSIADAVIALLKDDKKRKRYGAVAAKRSLSENEKTFHNIQKLMGNE